MAGGGALRYTLDLAHTISLPPPVDEPSSCRSATDVIDVDQPQVAARAAELVEGVCEPWARARRLFEFVRDEIRYDIAPRLPSREAWVASNTLVRGRGFCQQKAVLLAALSRAAGIPAAIAFEHIRDHKLIGSRFDAFIPDGTILFHGLNALWLDGAWRFVDATLERSLCQARGYQLVELRDGEHAHLPATDLAGKPHFDRLAQHGPFADLPHEITTLAVRIAPMWDGLRAIADETGETM